MADENFLGVFGHVAIDTLATVNQFPEPNNCEAVLERKTAFGGTGANLALLASHLGVKTALASFVGDDFPEQFRKILIEGEIDLTDLITIEAGRTPSIFLVSDDEHNQIGYVDQGVMVDQDGYQLLDHTISSSEIIHVGTGRPGYALRVCERAEELGKRVAFDPAQELHYVYTPDSFREVLPHANMFFCNERELGHALEYMDLNDPQELLEFIDSVVVTMGGDGSRIYHRDEELIAIPSVCPNRVVDTTGAGDAYRAGFYAGLSRGHPMEECGRLAASAASFIVESYGAITDLPTWEQVRNRAFGDRS